MVTVSIPLSSRKYPGLFAIVDEEDCEIVSRYRWRAKQINGHYYAYTTVVHASGKRADLPMHRLLTDAPSGVDVDHEDGDGLNNMRTNIRHASKSQNRINAGKNRNSDCPYKGVHWSKAKGAWRAMIQYNKRDILVGTTDDPVWAAHLYDAACIYLFGEFAKPNFPDPNPDAVAHVRDLLSKTLRNLRGNNTTGYRGVVLKPRGYIVQFRHAGIGEFYGPYSDPIDAARKDDERAREVHGGRAILNFPEEEP